MPGPQFCSCTWYSGRLEQVTSERRTWHLCDDFFDGLHHVMLGASWATPTQLVRRSFRNWFQRRYPYMFAKFRLVHDAETEGFR